MQERRSLKLSGDEWKRLEEEAVKFGTAASTGTNFGKPSWRNLVKKIANGEIKLFEKEEKK